MRPTRVLVCVLFPFLVSAQSTSGRNTTLTSSVPSTTTTGSTGSASSNVPASTTSSAAFPSLTGYSTCVTTCFGLATADANCTSEVDVNCYCASKAFPATIVACVQSNCTSELFSAETLAQSFCNLATSSTSLSFPLPSNSSSLSSTSNTAPMTTTTSIASTTTAATTATAAATTTTAAKGGAPSKKLGAVTMISLGVGFVIAVLYV